MTPPGEPTSPILAKKQIGRAACRGRGENSGGGGLLKKKKKNVEAVGVININKGVSSVEDTDTCADVISLHRVVLLHTSAEPLIGDRVCPCVDASLILV